MKEFPDFDKVNMVFNGMPMNKIASLFYGYAMTKNPKQHFTFGGSNTICVAVDIGGEDQSSKYLTYSFMMCTWEDWVKWKKEIDDLRSSTGYKKDFEF